MVLKQNGAESKFACLTDVPALLLDYDLYSKHRHYLYFFEIYVAPYIKFTYPYYIHTKCKLLIWSFNQEIIYSSVNARSYEIYWIFFHWKMMDYFWNYYQAPIFFLITFTTNEKFRMIAIDI